jgi:hypothetical protein
MERIGNVRRLLLSFTLFAVLAPAALALSGAAAARACALDSKPSAYADGVLVTVNNSTPTTSAQLTTWAYFVFPRSFAAHRAITLTENRREVAKTLVAAAMRRPWRWHFGDGKIAYGWTVRHSYAAAGRYRIVVDAYLPQTKQWYYFDQAIITIRRA